MHLGATDQYPLCHRLNLHISSQHEQMYLIEMYMCNSCSIAACDWLRSILAPTAGQPRLPSRSHTACRVALGTPLCPAPKCDHSYKLHIHDGLNTKDISNMFGEADEPTEGP